MQSVAILILMATQTPDTLPSGDEVVARYIEVKGGKTLLQSITSYRLRGEIRIDGETTSAFEIFQGKNRHVTINTLKDGSQTSHGTDGKHAWYIDQSGEAVAIKGEERLNYIRHYSTLHETLEWERQFEHIRCVRLTPIDGQGIVLK